MRRAMRRIWFCLWILMSLDTLPVSKNTQLISMTVDWLFLFCRGNWRRGYWLLSAWRQESRGADWGREDCSAWKTVPGTEPQDWDQNQGIKGVQGGCQIKHFDIIIPKYCILQDSVDKLMAKTNASMMAGGSSWLEQFTGAFEVQAGKWDSRHLWSSGKGKGQAKRKVRPE